jgi:hypothetical protein
LIVATNEDIISIDGKTICGAKNKWKITNTQLLEQVKDEFYFPNLNPKLKILISDTEE